MIDGDSSVRVRTILFGSERAVPLRISDTLFRIGQEAIANAIRHARPTTITLSLAYRPSRVELIIEDDGFGFQVSSASAGFGIRGMTKRAETIAARFTIRSAPGEGSAVHVVAPLQPSWLRAFLRRIPWRRPPRPEHFGSTIS
jgi:signal transduction histidine kinase